MPKENLDLFSFQSRKDGKLLIYFDDRLIKKFSARKGAVVLVKLLGKSDTEQQMMLAKLTGNFKRGNERNFER